MLSNLLLSYLGIGFIFYLLLNEPAHVEQRIQGLPLERQAPALIPLTHVISFFVYALAWPYIVLPGLFGIAWIWITRNTVGGSEQ